MGNSYCYKVTKKFETEALVELTLTNPPLASERIIVEIERGDNDEFLVQKALNILDNQQQADQNQQVEVFAKAFEEAITYYQA